MQLDDSDDENLEEDQGETVSDDEEVIIPISCLSADNIIH